MFRSKRLYRNVWALAGLLVSTGVSAVPFHMLAEGDSPVGNEVAGGITFVDLVATTRGSVLGGDVHPAPYVAGVFVAPPFDSGFALSVPSASRHVRSGNNSFVSGVTGAHAPLLGGQVVPPSAGVAQTPTPAVDGAGSFAEPASVALLGLGLAGLAYSSWLHRRGRRALGH